MPWIVVVVLGALAILGLRAQRPPRRRHSRGLGEKPKREWIVLPIEQDTNGDIYLLEAPPPLLRSTEKATVNWIVAGTCSGEHTVDLVEFRRDGQTYDLFETGGTKLSGKIPTNPNAPNLTLKGKLKKKDELPEQGIYTYSVVFDRGQKAREARGADGEFELCPVWPCE